MMRVEIYKGKKVVGAVDRKEGGPYKAFSYRDPKNPTTRNFLDFVEACRWVWGESKK